MRARRWLGAMLAVDVAAALCAFPFMPERVPIHWGIDGTADGFASRGVAVSLGLGLTLGVGALTLALLRRRVRTDQEESANEADARATTMLACLGSVSSVHLVALGAQAGVLAERHVAQLCLLGLSAALVVLGNVLGRVPRNRWMGIRTLWTLRSEQVWRRTHRAAAPAFVMTGLLNAVALLLTPLGFALPFTLVTVLGVGLGSCAYSYLVAQRLRE